MISWQGREHSVYFPASTWDARTSAAAPTIWHRVYRTDFEAPWLRKWTKRAIPSPRYASWSSFSLDIYLRHFGNNLHIRCIIAGVLYISEWSWNTGCASTVIEFANHRLQIPHRASTRPACFAATDTYFSI